MALLLLCVFFLCVFFTFILDVNFVGRTRRGHTCISLYVYIIINLFYYVLKLLLFCFCLVSLHGDYNVSAHHNGGFLPGIILLTQCYFHRGTLIMP